MRLVETIFVCSVVLVSAFVYAFVSTSSTKSFFQVWTTDSYGFIPKPVLQLVPDQNYVVVVGVQNTVGYIEYCTLKTIIQSAPLLNVSTSSAELSSYRFFLLDNETWENAVSFRIDAITENALVRVYGVQLNNSYFTVNLTSTFDPAMNGCFWQFRFELWAFNTSANDFYFTNTWASSPFLNMTR
jgi:hypothetical protein